MRIILVKSKKGYEKPGHKYIRREAKAEGYKYIYEEPKVRLKKPIEHPVYKEVNISMEPVEMIMDEKNVNEVKESKIDVKNNSEMLESDGFFNASLKGKTALFNKGKQRFEKLVEFLRKNELKDRNQFKSFIAGYDGDILKKYFSVTNDDLNSFTGDKFSNYIDISFSKDGHYVTFNYADKFFFDSISRDMADSRKPKWSIPLRMSRGITFDIETGELVSFPYEKFFNMNEYIDGNLKNLGKKFATQSVIASEKIDGILIQAFYDRHTDSVRFGTRAMLDKDERGFLETAENVMKKTGKYDEFKNYLKNNGYSVVLELVDPKFRVVVGYGKKTDLFLHGIRDLKTLEMLDFNKTRDAAQIHELSIPNTYEFSSFEELVSFQKNSKEDLEGFVLRFEDGSMIKAKTEAYFDKLKGLRSLSYKNIAESILAGEDWNIFKYEKIKSEELFDLADSYRKKVVDESNTLHDVMNKFMEKFMKDYQIDNTSLDNRKKLNDAFFKEYNNNVRNGIINQDKLNPEDFRVALNQLMSYNLKKNKSDRERYNKNLMKITVASLKDDKWMGAKLQDEQIN